MQVVPPPTMPELFGHLPTRRQRRIYSNIWSALLLTRRLPTFPSLSPSEVCALVNELTPHLPDLPEQITVKEILATLTGIQFALLFGAEAFQDRYCRPVRPTRHRMVCGDPIDYN